MRASPHRVYAERAAFFTEVPVKLSHVAAGLFAALLLPAAARAQTGVCDANPPASTQACIDAIQNNGGVVVNDIFRDSNGLTGPELPVFGTLFNNWPNCPDVTGWAGCAGVSTAPYDCPPSYGCDATAVNNFATASQYLNGLDHLWWHPCRLAQPNLVNGCPQWGCIADGVGGAYYPWEGAVFDLGGPSNKVAIFAQNDHGPQPCESLEYTVYLTDNPYSIEAILDPKTQGVDPNKWNRAVLTNVYTWGWFNTRAPDPAGHAVCGDTALYAVEDDSFTQVFSLPCGITFRYASIIAGNDGLDFPECGFDSQEAELDAVAGLTETGSAVCPDNDGDHFVDCNCPGAPPVCDCDDGNAVIHPGAPESCDSPDLNCDGIPGSCPVDEVCYLSVCITHCSGGENPFCPAGSTCQSTPEGNVCVPNDCTQGGCPAGGVCVNGICLPPCDNVVCPGNQICQDGQCLDPCQGIQCPGGQTCQNGECHPPCNCYQGDVGCQNQPGTVCDKNSTNLCVPPGCAGVVCQGTDVCDPSLGVCVSFCNPNVHCPSGQTCVDGIGCVPLCDAQPPCDQGFVCNPATGACEDISCKNVTCFPPYVCVSGQCVLGDGGAQGGGGMASSTSTSTSSGMGGHGGGTSGSGGQDPIDKGSCACRAAGDGDGPLDLGALGAAVALALAKARRRRRSLR